MVGAAGQDLPAAEVAQTFEASYFRPYLSHGAIGPSCAVAQLDAGLMTVWSHTQGAFPLRIDLSAVLAMTPQSVRVIDVPGAGCYGHNGADDVSLDAALMAQAVPGGAVKVQWMRDDEFAWAPTSPAMLMTVKAALDGNGRIVDWRHDVWSNSHAMRPGQLPGQGVNLLAAWYLEQPFHPTGPLASPTRAIIPPAPCGDRFCPGARGD